VFVQGRLKSREWDDKSGQKHRTLEVEVQRVQFLHVQETDKSGSQPDDHAASTETVHETVPVEETVPATVQDVTDEEQF
jgi:single-stranded DNA-binding protein